MVANTRKPCLSYARNPHLLMVKLPEYERNQRIVPGNYPNGVNLKGSLVDVGTGEVFRNVVYHLKGPITLYFVASDKAKLAQWHYVLQWINRLQCWGCSCLEGVTAGCCKHSAEVEAYIRGM